MEAELFGATDSTAPVVAVPMGDHSNLPHRQRTLMNGEGKEDQVPVGLVFRQLSQTEHHSLCASSTT